MKHDQNFHLDIIGKKEIKKSFMQNGIVKDYFIKNFEKLELKRQARKVDINKVVSTLAPPNILFQIKNGKVLTQLSYHLPDQEDGITIELNEKLKLNNIKYFFQKD